MRFFLTDIYSILRAAARLSDQRHGHKFHLLTLLILFKVKLRLSEIFKLRMRSQSFLGFRLEFFSYSQFVYLFEEIFIYRIYEFASATQEPFIVDCGSNIGMSILYFKWLYPQAKVLGFEADPKTFQLLQSNIKNNGLYDVELRHLALARSEGQLAWYSDPSKPGSVVGSLLAARGQPQNGVVRAGLLSRFINRKVDFLKMDIEGAEADCLEELSDANAFANISQMLIECHHNLPERPILSAALKKLEEHEFKFQISSDFRTPFLTNQTQDVLVYAYR